MTNLISCINCNYLIKILIDVLSNLQQQEISEQFQNVLRMLFINSKYLIHFISPTILKQDTNFQKTFPVKE